MAVAPPPAPGHGRGANTPNQISPQIRQMMANPPVVVNKVIPVGVNSAAAVVAAISAIFLAQMYLMMRLIYPIGRRPALEMMAVIAVFWFVPMAADLIYYSIAFPNQPTNIDHFGQASPLGVIIGLYETPRAKPVAGIVAQAAILVGLFLLYKMVETRRRIRSEAALR